MNLDHQTPSAPFPEFARVRHIISGTIGTVREAPAGCHIDERYVTCVRWDGKPRHDYALVYNSKLEAL
jgi:hypothetical protein